MEAIAVPFDPHLRDAVLRPIGETRVVEAIVKDSALTLELLPWETFVWEVDCQ